MSGVFREFAMVDVTAHTLTGVRVNLLTASGSMELSERQAKLVHTQTCIQNVYYISQVKLLVQSPEVTRHFNSSMEIPV